MLLTAVLSPAEESGYIALNPETGTASQGETVDEAIANLSPILEKWMQSARRTVPDGYHAVGSGGGVEE